MIPDPREVGTGCRKRLCSGINCERDESHHGHIQPSVIEPRVFAVAGSEIAVGIVVLVRRRLDETPPVVAALRPGPTRRLTSTGSNGRHASESMVAFTGMRPHGEVLAVLEASIAWQHGLKSKAIAFPFPVLRWDFFRSLSDTFCLF
jgi:hypothetical protein